VIAYGAQFAKVAVAHVLAVASPGPDFAMVVRQSISHGRRAALCTAVGVGSAILVHVTYAVLGIGIILRTNPLAFAAVKYAGAGYLAWIGAKALLSRPRTEMAAAPEMARAEIGSSGEPSTRAAFGAGFITNLLNPKATLFFVAIFASIIDPATPRLVQAAYGIWMSAFTMLWFALVAVFFTRERVRRAFLRGGHWIDRAMGAVFIGLAAALALASV
jgi:RhtB (resistance to homoserine/threonine) family protein